MAKEHKQPGVDPLLGEEAAQKLSPEDDRIILMPPPFHTIADEVEDVNDFWTTGVTNPSEIDYSKALIIADFGLGSDSSIVLYYGATAAPSVLYLKWEGSGNAIRHKWVETHSSFDDFVDATGLDCLRS